LKNLKTVAEVKDILKEICTLKSIMQQAYGLGITEAGLLAISNELVPYVMRFIKRNTEKNLVEVIDIEDNYWNPVYGLKGKLDATVRMNHASFQKSKEFSVRDNMTTTFIYNYKLVK